MKQYRQVLFAMGKFIKYTIWVCTAFFFYHYYLALYKDKPEEAFLANEGVLNYAFAAKFAYQDLVKLLTRPPVDSLLLERPPGMPGQVPVKTLVLNLNGLLIHSEYKLGIGFEVLKRPGLSVFLARMRNFYEIVLFGDNEKGVSYSNSYLNFNFLAANRRDRNGFGPEWNDLHGVPRPRGNYCKGWHLHQRLFLPWTTYQRCCVP